MVREKRVRLSWRIKPKHKAALELVKKTHDFDTDSEALNFVLDNLAAYLEWRGVQVGEIRQKVKNLGITHAEVFS